ncbi:MAG: DUF6690 family protein [Pirellulales bacterium]
MAKPTTAAMVLAAAVGVPYAVDQSGTKLTQAWSTATSPESAAPAAGSHPEATLGQPVAPPQLPSPTGPGALIYQSTAPLEGIPTYSLAEVLRMDVTREWVYHRWARKSTGLADPELFGIRVPLVTGTRMTDLAGSLTYYFNRAGQVDRIAFRGRTADSSQLVQLVTQQYGLQMQPSVVAGEQLYQLKEDDRVVSELRTRPEPVLWSTSPHDSFLVEMELNRPDSGRYLTRPIPTIDLPQPISAAPPPGKVPVNPNTPLGQVQTNVEQAAAAEAEAKRIAADSKAQSEALAAEAANEAGAAAEAAAAKLALPPRFRWPN